MGSFTKRLERLVVFIVRWLLWWRRLCHYALFMIFVISIMSVWGCSVISRTWRCGVIISAITLLTLLFTVFIILSKCLSVAIVTLNILDPNMLLFRCLKRTINLLFLPLLLMIVSYLILTYLLDSRAHKFLMLVVSKWRQLLIAVWPLILSLEVFFGVMLHIKYWTFPLYSTSVHFLLIDSLWVLLGLFLRENVIVTAFWIDDIFGGGFAGLLFAAIV